MLPSPSCGPSLVGVASTDISDDYADHSSDTAGKLNSDSVGQVVGFYRTGRACVFATD